MSTVVYQGLPSSLESQLSESRTLLLKLASPWSHFPHSLEMAISTALDSDAKILFRENFLNVGDALKQNSSNFYAETSPKPQFTGLRSQTQDEEQGSYVHPLVKRSSAMLSDKSLELCTESLGSETGTDVIQDCDIFPSDANNGSYQQKDQPTKSQVSSSKRIASKAFPPPLTTMAGSETVQVRPVRENGRLILQAVKLQPRVSCFRAERSNGRLQLRLREPEYACDSDLESTGDEDCNSIIENNANEEFENRSEKQLEAECSEPESWNDQEMGVDISDGDNEDGSLELENAGSRGRCKESRHGNTEGLSLDSESFWVATS